MEIELNNRRYEFIEDENKQTSITSYSAIAIQMLAMMSAYHGNSGKARTPKYTLNQIVGEYALIEQKKSNLPRAQREHVINQFKKHFKEITEDGNDKPNHD